MEVLVKHDTVLSAQSVQVVIDGWQLHESADGVESCPCNTALGPLRTGLNSLGLLGTPDEQWDEHVLAFDWLFLSHDLHRTDMAIELSWRPIFHIERVW
jgi:hypothetical protein